MLTQQQFDEYYGAYNRRLVMFLRSKFSRQSAEDIAAEAWMRAWRGRHTFRSDATFFTWICKIAQNVGVESHRRASSRPVEVIPQSLRSFLSEEPGIDRKVIARERLTAIMRTMRPQARPVILLRLDGMSFEDISAHLGVKKNTAKVQFFRWKQKFDRRSKLVEG